MGGLAVLRADAWVGRQNNVLYRALSSNQITGPGWIMGPYTGSSTSSMSPEVSAWSSFVRRQRV